jgi:hypothetical protein
MWVKWRDLYRSGKWQRFGGPLVKRVRESLVADRIIEEETERATDPETNREVGPPKWTGRVRPIDDVKENDNEK